MSAITPSHWHSWGETQWHDVATGIDDDGLVLIRLNRPDKLNAFTVTMAHELMAAFAMAGEDDRVRAVVVTGAGSAFCAGMDLHGDGGNVFGIDEAKSPTMASLVDGIDDPTVTEGVLDLGGRLARAIHRCPKPVAAAINGPAVGIGATMTLAMDFRLACRTARIGFVFNRIGIVPEACSTYFLPALVGPQQALEWLYLAQPIGAEEAATGGLVRSLHDPEELLGDCLELMRKLTRGRSPLAQAMTRQLVRRGNDAEVLGAHLRESLAMHWLCRSEGKEGVAAFLEKRPAKFTGKASSDLPPDWVNWFR